MLVEKVGWEHSSKEMERRKLVQTGRGDEFLTILILSNLSEK